MFVYVCMIFHFFGIRFTMPSLTVLRLLKYHLKYLSTFSGSSSNFSLTSAKLASQTYSMAFVNLSL